jgi:CDP-diacylglycerol---glycerol-3-phosphate 3-phosphatidyltransferase
MVMEKFRRDISVRLTNPLVQALAHTSITPDMLTWVGFCLTVVAGILIGTGHLFIGGWMVLVAGAFDLLDGALARYKAKTTVFGSALDSTLDRLSEAVLLLAIMTWYVQNDFGWMVIVCGGTLVGSFMVSYVRARAEGLGLELKEGIFTRVERVIVLSLGLLFGKWSIILISALLIILVLSFITAGQRLFLVWQKTKNMV